MGPPGFTSLARLVRYSRLAASKARASRLYA